MKINCRGETNQDNRRKYFTKGEHIKIGEVNILQKTEITKQIQENILQKKDMK